MPKPFIVRLEIIAPAPGSPQDEVRSVEILATANSPATAGAKAVAHAKTQAWRVLAIQDVRPAPEHLTPDDQTTLVEPQPRPNNLLTFPTGKPN